MSDLSNAMVGLEKSFADWRWRMLAAGIGAPEPLQELENHLREDVERRMQSAMNAEEALAAAVRQIGEAGEITREFAKANRTPWSIRSWWIVLGIGSFGFWQTAMLNFVGPVVFHRHSSVFCSAKWWANWFPSYIVWISFILTGSVLGLIHWRERRRAVLN